jgi:hypothetical protein
MTLGIKIDKIYATDINGYKIKLRFTNGKKGVVSLDPIFRSPKNLSEEILRGGMFDKCVLKSGALAWPNGFEICSDTVYLWFEQQKSTHAA